MESLLNEDFGYLVKNINMNPAISPNFPSLLPNDIYPILTKFTDSVTLNLAGERLFWFGAFFSVPTWLSVLLVIVCHKQNTCKDFCSINFEGFFFCLKVLFSVQLFACNSMLLTLPKTCSNSLAAFPEL